MIFITDGENEIIPNFEMVFGITENGLIETRQNEDGKEVICGGNFFLNPYTWEIVQLKTSDYSEEHDAFARLIKTIYLHPVLLALSFMHCKNTVLTEHNPPVKVQRKRAKNNRPPLTKYYTLDIERPKTILKTEGKIDEVGLQRALHICRGHFKDYSNGKGLFGKYKGLYWWDSTVRGNPDAGRIKKDYAIKI